MTTFETLVTDYHNGLLTKDGMNSEAIGQAVKRFPLNGGRVGCLFADGSRLTVDLLHQLEANA